MENLIINEELLKKLVFNNYIGMLNRREKASIVEIKNNPDALFDLLYSIGASKQLLQVPAHREKLEECLKKMIEISLEGLGGECDSLVKPLEDGMLINYEDFKFSEKCILRFPTEDSYEFKCSRNIGEVLREIIGNKDTIEETSKTETIGFPVKTSIVTTTKTLDDNGFVISKAVKLSITAGKEGRSETGEIKRDGLKVLVNSDNKRRIWNGKPDDINGKTSTTEELSKNIYIIISKYPEARKYYEELVGKEMVDKILEVNKNKEY